MWNNKIYSQYDDKKKQLCKEVKLVIATTLCQLRNDSHYAAFRLVTDLFFCKTAKLIFPLTYFTKQYS